jgi:hypothetical protein
MVAANKSNTAADAQAEMIALRDQIEQRLISNADYQALKALNRTIAELYGVSEGRVSEGRRAAKPKADEVEISGMTQADATEVLLTRVLHEPTSTTNMVRALGAHGIAVGGTNPNINLSSVLSKDGRFRSVRFKGGTCWWVRNVPYPGELDFSNQS